MKLVQKDRLTHLILLLLISAGIWHLLEGYDIRAGATLFPILLSLQILLTDWVDVYLTRHTHQTRWFNILMAPGTILHELSHLFSALFTGCIVTKVQLFKPNPQTGTLGFVQYQQPVDKWTVIRDLIVSFAPFFGCGLFLFAVNLLYGGDLLHYALDLNLKHLDQIIIAYLDSSLLLMENISQLDLSTITGILLLFLQVSFAFGAASSSIDLKGSFSSLYKHPLSTIFLLMILALLVYMSNLPAVETEGLPLAAILKAILSLSIIIVLVSQIILVASFPALYVGIQYLKLKGTHRYIPLALTLITTLVLLQLDYFNILASLTVFAAATILTANKKYFIK